MGISYPYLKKFVIWGGFFGVPAYNYAGGNPPAKVLLRVFCAAP